MRPEHMTTLEEQVVELIRTYQQEHHRQAMPHTILLEQFEKSLLEDEKFKSAEYLTPVLANLKAFKRIESQDAADGGLEYTIVE